MTIGTGLAALLLAAGVVMAQETPAPQPAQPLQPPPAPPAPPALPQPVPTAPPTPTDISNSKARIKMGSEAWNFGVKMSGEPCEIEVPIENTGEEALKFTIRSSCGCTVPELTKAKRLEGQEFHYQLDPGQKDTMKVTYNTKKNVRNVSQTITIVTNDPTKQNLMFKVEGEVRSLYEMESEGKPTDRIQFARIARDDKVDKSLTLKNGGDKPVTLKLKPPTEGPFDIKFEEVTAGKEYKLTAITKPPLRDGANTIELVLETDHDSMKELKVPVSAFVQPRVIVSPPMLRVAQSTTAPVKQRVTVRYTSNKPIKITEIKASHPGIKGEVLPPEPQAAGAAAGMDAHQIEVTLPPGSELPKEGATLTIVTDDSDPQYQKLDVKVMVLPNVVRPNVPGGLQSTQPPAQPGAPGQPTPPPAPAPAPAPPAAPPK